jgi:tripartite ATP-independent transporter DctP family solute receptor
MKKSELRRRKLLAWLTILVVAIVLATLSGSVWAAARVTMKLATAYPPGNESVVAAEKFKELVESKSNGGIQVQIFSGGSVGGEREILQALKLGSVQASTSGMMPIHMFAVKYGFFDAPFIMRDYDHFKKVWASPMASPVHAIFKDNRFRAAGVYYRGVRNITTNKQILKADDLKGIKMRVPQDPSWVKIWTGLGTLPTVVALPELFTSLQTGVADASEGPASQLFSYKLNEVQKYLVLSGHMVAVGVLTMGDAFLNGLSKADQDIVLSAAKEACALTDKWSQDEEGKIIDKLLRGGMTKVEPDRASFREKARPAVGELFKGEWNVTTWDEILKY